MIQIIISWDMLVGMGKLDFIEYIIVFHIITVCSKGNA